MNVLMVNMLEEMNASEQLWASHTGGSKLATIVVRYFHWLFAFVPVCDCQFDFSSFYFSLLAMFVL